MFCPIQDEIILIISFPNVLLNGGTEKHIVSEKMIADKETQGINTRKIVLLFKSGTSSTEDQSHYKGAAYSGLKSLKRNGVNTKPTEK